MHRPCRQASVPLIGSNGVILGYLTWDQERPGLGLIKEASPALIGFSLLAAGVLWFLLKRLRRAAGELHRSRSRAQYLAFHDTLTGLPNRALFEDRLKRALLSVARDNRKIALLYLDLDRFKNVNDTFGHAAGDELVRQTAARLESSIRQVDTVARLGGDEFAIIIFDAKDISTAEELCERLLAEINKPFNLAGNEVFVGASIGVAISNGAGADPADLLRKADIALYEAKKNGRGRHQVFAGDMDDLIARKRMIEIDLRKALSTGGELKLAYQPIYAADSRPIVGAEALIRWEHPIHGVLSPAHFVTIAEERGMIGLLGDWVLEEVARFAALSDLPWIAFNVSPLQLRDPGFASRVLAVLDEAKVDPSRLQIEIIESALLENSQITRDVLTELRDAGIRIALDDFGTGYSSINYLKRHIIDKLKIDRSFVRMLGSAEGTGDRQGDRRACLGAQREGDRRRRRDARAARSACRDGLRRIAGLPALAAGGGQRATRLRRLASAQHSLNPLRAVDRLGVLFARADHGADRRAADAANHRAGVPAMAAPATAPVPPSDDRARRRSRRLRRSAAGKHHGNERYGQDAGHGVSPSVVRVSTESGPIELTVAFRRKASQPFADHQPGRTWLGFSLRPRSRRQRREIEAAGFLGHRHGDVVEAVGDVAGDARRRFPAAPCGRA